MLLPSQINDACKEEKNSQPVDQCPSTISQQIPLAARSSPVIRNEKQNKFMEVEGGIREKSKSN